MNAPKGFYVYSASALFAVGLGISIVIPESIAAAGSFIGAGLMGIANAIGSLAKPAAPSA